MVPRQSTKLSIQHPADPNCLIAGILEQIEPGHFTEGRKIALILHGAAGHKDYLFQKRLAQRLPIDSVRFDFRGSHETAGTWRQGNLQDDVEDIIAVVDYLKQTYRYSVDLVIGHSRGSIVAMTWLCSLSAVQSVPAFVNVSGRFRMRVRLTFLLHRQMYVSDPENGDLQKIYDTPIAEKWKQAFAEQGYFIWTPIVARKQVEIKIYPQDVEAFANWDTGIDHFPRSTDVLTLHGLSDERVPVYDAVLYAKALSGRHPGTHSLELVEDADHNFTGRQDLVAQIISEWYDAHTTGTLRTGIWDSGNRGKL